MEECVITQASGLPGGWCWHGWDDGSGALYKGYVAKQRKVIMPAYANKTMLESAMLELYPRRVEEPRQHGSMVEHRKEEMARKGWDNEKMKGD